MTSFIGWEWTQLGETPETAYGHRNIVLKNLDDPPPRPFAAPTKFAKVGSGLFRILATLLWFVDSEHKAMHKEILNTFTTAKEQPACDPGVDTRKLPKNCTEVARTPVELAEKFSTGRSRRSSSLTA